ncbi:hypothetical protein [Alloalcanivorax xenomutans]|uniref:hypothetical protein n=1 Tax=Alloalcanivorax xenomutans TaxID=1094342 RepID=UPI003BA9E540
MTDSEFMDALAELVRREGIRHLTIGEMASRLRCSRRRLYSIAQTKEDIFCAAVEYHFKSLLDEGETLIEESKDITETVAAYQDVGVRASARISVQFIKDVENSERARASFDAYQKARAAGLARIIDQGVQEGRFVPCHGLLVSEALLGASIRIRRSAFLEEANLSMEEAFAEFYRIFLGGLLSDKPSSPGTKTAGRKDKKNGAGAKLGKSRSSESKADDEIDRALIAAWNRP